MYHNNRKLAKRICLILFPQLTTSLSTIDKMYAPPKKNHILNPNAQGNNLGDGLLGGD